MTNINKAQEAFGKLGPVAEKLSGLLPSVSTLVGGITDFATPPTLEQISGEEPTTESTVEAQIAVYEGYGKILNHVATIVGHGFDIMSKMDENRQDAKMQMIQAEEAAKFYAAPMETTLMDTSEVVFQVKDNAVVEKERKAPYTMFAGSERSAERLA